MLKAAAPAGVTTALLAHIHSPAVVAAAADALRVLSLATWRPPKGSFAKRPALRDYVLETHLGARSGPRPSSGPGAGGHGGGGWLGIAPAAKGAPLP